MELKKNYKFWFATGSQDLYGDECLSHVAKHAQIIVQNFNESGILPFEVVWKPTLIDSTSIRRTLCRCHHMDAHILPSKIMDRRITGI